MTTALLIIDIQHALCSGDDAAFGIESVIEKVNALSARTRACGSPVILIQHEEDEGPLQFGTEGWALAGGLLAADTHGCHQILPRRFEKRAPLRRFRYGDGELFEQLGLDVGV